MSDARRVDVFTTGGTIDKVYFDALSEFKVGDNAVGNILSEANVQSEVRITELMRKDSLELTDQDRATIRTAVEVSEREAVLITHGTDTMTVTAAALAGIEGKTIVFTGAMQPARLKSTDAVFNVGFALAGALTLPPGLYIAMNGRFLDALHAKKNRDAQRFEES